MDINNLNKSIVWVLIPTFNRRDVLKSCLNDLLKQDYQNTRIVVVDDSSKDGTLEMIHTQYPSVIVLRGDGKRWWSGSMNLGLGWVMAHANKDDYLLSFNDDVRIESDYVIKLISAAKNAPNSSLIGSVAVDSQDKNRVVYCGTRIDWRRGLWKGISINQSETSLNLIKTDSLPGRGTLIPLSVFEDVGFYDDKRFPQYFGDEDFALRAQAAGASLFVSRDAIVQSHVHMTGTGRHSQTFRTFFRSLWSIRSPNQLSRRSIFIFTHCPSIYKFQFLILDLIKVTTAFWRNKEIRA